MQSNTVSDFVQSICSNKTVEKCVKNKMTFANTILGNGKGPLPTLTAHMVQVLTIGAFTHCCIMEKFVDWREEIEEKFEAKADTSPRPMITSDDDPDVDTEYGPEKQQLCAQITEIIRSSCGEGNITPAFRKKRVLQEVRNGLHFPGVDFFAQ
jgi:hypothetical protein